jgi:3alpha(or 20beta)-hydroxysteroid dehydrogenase
VGSLDGRTAIISGAASGMGAAAARRFVDEGANVVAADIAEAAGPELTECFGGAARYQRMDVRDANQWEETCAVARETYGSIDILVNYAGVIVWGGVLDTGEDTFERAMEVNCLGTFLGMRAVVRDMSRQGRGSIINVGSTSGLVGSPRSIAYTASKWAVRGMTKAAALELADRGIRVNAIHPGVIDTPMSRSARNSRSGDLTSGVPPLGRLGTAEEVAALAVFLASDQSGFTTGADHVVDGGRSAGW